MNVKAETPEIVRGEYVYVGSKSVKARWITILGEDFLEFGDGVRKPCGNCDNGGVSGYKSAYAGVYAGECFQCRGTGVGSAAMTEEKAAKLVKNRIAARKRAARKATEKADAAAAAGLGWRTANATLADMLDAIYIELSEAADGFNENGHTVFDAVEARWGSFLTQMANLVGMGRPLTEGQATAALKAIDEALTTQAAEQTRQDAARYYGTVGGKVVATGTVTVAARVEVATYTGYSTEIKMLVIVEGTGEFAGVTFKLWGTGATLYTAERGQTVEVRGTIKDHDEYEGVKQTVITRGKITAA